MSFAGFDLSGASSVRVISYTLGGSRRSEVLDCTLEIEYRNGVRELSFTLEPDTLNLTSFLAFIDALNRKLGSAQ